MNLAAKPLHYRIIEIQVTTFELLNYMRQSKTVPSENLCVVSIQLWQWLSTLSTILANRLTGKPMAMWLSGKAHCSEEARRAVAMPGTNGTGSNQIPDILQKWTLQYQNETTGRQDSAWPKPGLASAVWQSVASDDSDHAGLLHNIATAPSVMHNTTQHNTTQLNSTQHKTQHWHWQCLLLSD